MAPPEQWSYGSCFSVSFLLAVGLTYVLRWLAPRIGMVDRPGPRKNHTRPMPLLGGVAVYFAAVVSYLAFAGGDHRTLWLIAGASVVLAFGLLDDRVPLRGRFRFVIQLLGAGGIVAAGVQFNWFSSAAANRAVSILWLVGLMNAINCLDCADGIAPGVVIIAGGAFCFIALAQGHFAVAMMAAAVSAACAGFLVFNFPPASIFLGDAGSTFLGFLLGALAIASSDGAAPARQAWIAALPLGVPVWDIILVHARRYRAGTRSLRALLESAGRDHLPHRLAQAGLSPRQVAVAAYLMAALLAIPGVLVARYQLGTLWLTFEIVFIGFIAGEQRFGGFVAGLSSLMRRARPSPGASEVARLPTEAVASRVESVTSTAFWPEAPSASLSASLEAKGLK
jgi:UDP-GlcNAc:undecaprenyl-phosphate GlcNAc-1-phosphate transferase